MVQLETSFMHSQEIFAVVVRVIGLVSLIYLLATSFVFFGSGMPWLFVVRCIVWAVVSIWMLRGAPQLVRFAYPDGK